MLPSSLDDFKVDHMAEDGVRRRVPLADAWAVRFEAAAPRRPVERRPGRDLVAFDPTRLACVLVGWEYRLVRAPNLMWTANLRWLAGHRHPRHDLPGLAAALRVAFAGWLRATRATTCRPFSARCGGSSRSRGRRVSEARWTMRAGKIRSGGGAE
jgi:hypothetical protein